MDIDTTEYPTPEAMHRAQRAKAARPFIQKELNDMLRGYVNDLCEDGIDQQRRDDLRSDIRAVRRLGQRCDMAIEMGEPEGKE